MTINEH